MKPFSALLSFALAMSTSAMAQPNLPMAASAPKSTGMAGDCASPRLTHNHGVEKGLPVGASKACPSVNAASAVKGKAAARAKARHDHAEFNKNE